MRNEESLRAEVSRLDSALAASKAREDEARAMYVAAQKGWADDKATGQRLLDLAGQKLNEAQARIRVLEARLNGRCSCDGAGDSPCSVHGHEMAQQDLRVRAEQERDSFAKHVAMLREAVCAARSRIGFQEKKTSHIKECGCELCFDALAICQVAEALEATSPAITEWMERHDVEVFSECLAKWNTCLGASSHGIFTQWLEAKAKAKAREAGEKK